MRTLLLFTRDLRVHDHPALAAAVHDGEVLPLFVLDPRLLQRSPIERRS
jgi:deoxyribodipyrimidine photo-lyase